MYFIYSFLMGAAALLLSPYWVVKGLRQEKNTCRTCASGLDCLLRLSANCLRIVRVRFGFTLSPSASFSPASASPSA